MSNQNKTPNGISFPWPLAADLQSTLYYEELYGEMPEKIRTKDMLNLIYCQVKSATGDQAPTREEFDAVVLRMSTRDFWAAVGQKSPFSSGTPESNTPG